MLAWQLRLVVQAIFSMEIFKGTFSLTILLISCLSISLQNDHFLLGPLEDMEIDGLCWIFQQLQVPLVGPEYI